MLSLTTKVYWAQIRIQTWTTRNSRPFRSHFLYSDGVMGLNLGRTTSKGLKTIGDITRPWVETYSQVILCFHENLEHVARCRFVLACKLSQNERKTVDTDPPNKDMRHTWRHTRYQFSLQTSGTHCYKAGQEQKRALLNLRTIRTILKKLSKSQTCVRREL